MNLKILLPYLVFADLKGIRRIVAETAKGSFALLPHRLDCAAVLTPGILLYETEDEKEVYLAIDEGILVKAGTNVLVSVRNAIGGAELGNLHKSVEKEFINTGEEEKKIRSAIAKLELNLFRQFEELRKK